MVDGGKNAILIIDDRLTDYTPVTHIKGEVNRQGIRKSTLNGQDYKDFPIHSSFLLADVHLYKQLGNSVTVPGL